MKHALRITHVLMITGLALTLVAAARRPASSLFTGDAEEFDEAAVFIEINSTDGDAGFQGIIDGDAWDRARLLGPDGKNLFQYKITGQAALQGWTELFWESAEPSFDDLDLSVFLDRFPEGDYSFGALTIEGGMLRSVVELTHNLPAGPVITSPLEDEVVDDGIDLFVAWEQVLDDFQRPGLGDLDSDIIGYIVTIEAEFENEDGEEVTEVMNIDVPADELSTVIPAGFLKPDREYKVEIGAIEEGRNSTFSEVPFCTHDDDECPDDEE